MGFVPVASPAVLTEGEIDYRLARQAVLNDYRAGLLSEQDVCDAHPELRRVAREYSTATRDECPICPHGTVAMVSYVFGPRLPSHGRCVNSLAEIERIRKRKGTFTCYVVEVCPDCAWNHLRRVGTCCRNWHTDQGVAAASSAAPDPRRLNRRPGSLSSSSSGRPWDTVERRSRET